RMPVGIGEPVFEKLDANLSRALFSIGAVKGVEIGDGFAAARSTGSENNDEFLPAEHTGEPLKKASNHAGGILGGMSDGSPIHLRAAIKPTPSIFQTQQTVNKAGEDIQIQIKGRHDPVIVPRAVVVIESMAAITVMDALLANMTARLDRIQQFYSH
ncbi:chorismate synthase, partial [Frisingicoccus sp.]|uniref:chorismate synthase n=1 Tax=Frisingicoccus sp. TaxID=1918627 RepID=UPI003736BDC2